MRSGTIGLLLGLASGATVRPDLGLLLLGAFGGCATVAVLWRRSGRWRVLLLTLAAGWIWGGWDALQRLDSQLPESLAGRDLQLEGRIVSLPEPRRSFGRPGLRFEFQVSRCQPVDTDAGDCAHIGRVLLSWYESPPLASGERWRVTARLKPPRGLRNPGGFDYQRYLYRRGIDATGYVSGRDPAARMAPAAGWAAQRWKLAETLREQMSALPQSRWLRALAMADQRDLGNADWDLLRATGTVHLFVVSGLHISLAGGLLLMLVHVHGRLLPLAAVAVWPAIGLAIGVTAIYAALTGWGIPAQRAWLMFTAATLIWWVRRPIQPVFHLIAVAALVLVIQPVAILAPGFWLSFGAVAVILLAVVGRRPAVRGPAALWRVQWTVSLGLLVPLGLFGAPLAVVSVPANLVAVPVVTLVVPLNLLAVLLMALWPAGAMSLWQIADMLLGWVLAWLGLLADLQGQPWQPPQTHPAGWALALFGGLLWMMPRGWPGRIWAPMLIAPLLAMRPAAPAPSEWQATVLDVGQGLAVLVETAGHRLLYDAGPRWGDYDSGERVVLPYLAYRGHTGLDLLMVSHADNDHAGGVAHIQHALGAVRTLTGEAVPGVAPASRCRAGQRWRWDGVEFAVLHPFSARTSGNAASCVLLVSGGGHRLVLTGDIGRNQERAILDALQTASTSSDSRYAGYTHHPAGDVAGALAGAVLVAPHHGSRSSSSADWIAAVQPRAVIFSAGWRHRFGHPHTEVVERYRRSGASLWNTAEHGALRIFAAAGELQIVPTRQ